MSLAASGRSRGHRPCPTADVMIRDRHAAEARACRCRPGAADAGQRSQSDPGPARVAETGGGYTEIRFARFGAAFAAVADELHSQYLSDSHRQRDGKVHDISIRLASRAA